MGNIESRIERLEDKVKSPKDTLPERQYLYLSDQPPEVQEEVLDILKTAGVIREKGVENERFGE